MDRLMTMIRSLFISGSIASEYPTLEEYLTLTREYLDQAQKLKSPEFNDGQCKYLVEKLNLALESATSYIDAGFSSKKLPAPENFQQLYVLSQEVQNFIRSCCSDSWLQGGLLLSNVSDHVLSVGFYLHLWTLATSAHHMTSAQINNFLAAEVEIVNQIAASDGRKLSGKIGVNLKSNVASSSDYELAVNLIQVRLERDRSTSMGDSPSSSPSSFFEVSSQSVEQLERLGRGSAATVYRAKWMGMDVAKKTFYAPNFLDFEKEVSIIGGLSHPNITSLFCYTRENRECSIIMELMEENLFSLIQRRLSTRDFPFDLFEAISIIHQIAMGMCYLQERKIVHRDLKSLNILVNCASKSGPQYVIAKVADFGLSEIKHRSMTYSDQTPNVRTTRWMAPELMRASSSNIDSTAMKFPFKSDVYSFAMACYEIVSGQQPFANVNGSRVRNMVLNGNRPELPEHCHVSLKALIEKCWSDDASLRPEFHDICAELWHLKYGLLFRHALLQDLDRNGRRDALVALYALSSSMAIPVSQLPQVQTILNFLRENGDVDVTNAAAGLFALTLNERAVNAEEILQTKGVLEAILNLLYINPDSPGSERIASTILEMAKEDERVRIRIAEPGLRGLDILVQFVRREQCTKETKELLTATLVRFCRDGENFQEVVIEANGDTFLLASLQEKISMEEAAQGLLELVKNPNMIERILEGGFVRTAMGSISQTFADTAIAQGLSCIASTDKGLNQIYSASSDAKLRTLLEKCTEGLGQDAAASIIAKLYPLLCGRAEDMPRLNNLISETCPGLLNSLKRFHPNHIKESLQTLAAFATGMWGRRFIHECQGVSTLIDHLSTRDTEIRGLVLKILAKMTSDVPENDENRDANTRIIEAARDMFFPDYKIREQLLSLVKSEEFCRPERTESMKDLLIILRNLSLGGPYFCDGLVHQGAVNALLTVLKRPESPLPIVTELAVTALEELLSGHKGKQAFMSEGGIEPLVAILKADAFLRGTGRESVSSVVLTLFVGRGDGKQIGVARAEKHRRSACQAIFTCDILAALSRIIFDNRTPKTKWQAAFLIKLLAKYGPTARVIADIKDKEYFHALIQLRRVEDCQSMAVDVLEFLGSRDKRLKFLGSRGTRLKKLISDNL